MSRIASVATHNVILTEVRTDDGLVGVGGIHGAPMPRLCEWVSRFGEIIRGGV
jgi:L-alanine-DL-glutamate epimerase-like enolase superfamily enzyme